MKLAGASGGPQTNGADVEAHMKWLIGNDEARQMLCSAEGKGNAPVAYAQLRRSQKHSALRKVHSSDERRGHSLTARKYYRFPPCRARIGSALEHADKATSACSGTVKKKGVDLN